MRSNYAVVLALCSARAYAVLKESDQSNDGTAGQPQNETSRKLITVTCDPVTVTERVTETVTASGNVKATSSELDVSSTLTSTIYVTVQPTPPGSDEQFSSTTTVFVTAGPAVTTTVGAGQPSGPGTSPASAPAQSPKSPGNPGTIPQISINPSTTVQITGSAPAPPAEPAPTASSAASRGAGGSASRPGKPGTTTADADPATTPSKVAPTSSTTQPAVDPPKKAPGNPGTIPQVSINPTATVVLGQ